MKTFCIIGLVMCLIALFMMLFVYTNKESYYWCAIIYLLLNEPQSYKAYKEAQKIGVKVYLYESDYVNDKLNGKLPKYFLFPHYYLEGGICFSFCTTKDGYIDIITYEAPLVDYLLTHNNYRTTTDK